MPYQSLFNAIAGVMLTISLALAGWTLNQVVLHGQEIVSLKANGFTVREAAAVWQQIYDLQRQTATAAERALYMQRQLDRLNEERDRGDHGDLGPVLPNPQGG